MGKYGKDYAEECRERKAPLEVDDEPETVSGLIVRIGEDAYEDMVVEEVREKLG